MRYVVREKGSPRRHFSPCGLLVKEQAKAHRFQLDAARQAVETLNTHWPDGEHFVRVRILSPAESQAEERGRQRGVRQVREDLLLRGKKLFGAERAVLIQAFNGTVGLECPCQGELDDPGPHVEACPWKDPKYGNGPL